MSATAWLIIAIVGFSLAGIAFVATIILFIKMNIPAIIGDLTGKTVAREIKAMRESNASSGDKRFRPSAVNLERGTLTEKVMSTDDLKKAHASKRLDKTDGLGKSGKFGQRKGGTTGLSGQNSVVNPVIDEKAAPATEKLSDNVTEVLSDGVTDVPALATEVLSDATEVLTNGTTVLSGGTTVLNGTDELVEEDSTPVVFKIVRSEIVIHANEVIELS
ncbi:MAG: hypothetical protein K2H01_04560 [Ruminococcus sp.]|nr:hypothetical protein [Ruminococcus sp.]